jgi:hypothetical protein
MSATSSWPAGDRTTRRARTWLAQHGMAGVEPTPLLVARLGARSRVRAGTVAVAAAGILIMVITQFGDWSDSETVHDGAARRLLGYVAFVLLIVLAAGLGQRAAVRAERRLSATLGRRVAHPTPPTWRTVLGLRYLMLAVAGHGGAVTVAAIAAVAVTRTRADRVTVALLLTGLIALAALTAAAIANIVRQPALADDAVSLAFDDRLRADSARVLAATPLPGLITMLTVVWIAPNPPWPVTMMCFGLLGLPFLVLVLDLHGQAATRPPAATR